MNLCDLDRATRDALLQMIANNATNATHARLKMALPSSFNERDKPGDRLPWLVGMTRTRLPLYQGEIDALASRVAEIKRAMDTFAPPCDGISIRTDLMIQDYPITVGGKIVRVSIDSTQSTIARDVHSIKLATKLGNSRTKQRTLNFIRKNHNWNFHHSVRNSNLLTALVIVVRALKISGFKLRGSLAIKQMYYSWENSKNEKRNEEIRNIVARDELSRLLFME